MSVDAISPTAHANRTVLRWIAVASLGDTDGKVVGEEMERSMLAYFLSWRSAVAHSRFSIDAIVVSAIIEQ